MREVRNLPAVNYNQYQKVCPGVSKKTFRSLLHGVVSATGLSAFMGSRSMTSFSPLLEWGSLCNQSNGLLNRWFQGRFQPPT
jgi:hypothetical protein